MYLLDGLVGPHGLLHSAHDLVLLGDLRNHVLRHLFRACSPNRYVFQKRHYKEHQQQLLFVRAPQSEEYTKLLEVELSYSSAVPLVEYR